MGAEEQSRPAPGVRDLLPDLVPALDEIRERAAAADEQGRPDARSLEVLRASGLTALGVPREFGGRGADAFTVNDAVRLVAKEDASLAIVLFLHSAVTARIVRWGTRAQQNRHLPAIAAGRCLAASVWSEQKSGASKARLGTTAEPCAPGSVRIQGRKTFATGAGIADVYLVLAQTSDEEGDGNYGSTAQSLFLVDADNAGVQAHPGPDLVGMRASATGFVSFDDCIVTEDSRLGTPEETPAVISHPHHLGLTLGAVSAGISRAALTVALDEAAARGLLEHQTMRHALADMEATAEAADALVDRAGALGPHGGAFRLALYAKVHASAVAESTCARIQQVLGSAAFVTGHPLDRLARDARAVAHMGPPNHLCREMASATWTATVG